MRGRLDHGLAAAGQPQFSRHHSVTRLVNSKPPTQARLLKYIRT